ncbi:hypothetical protein LTR70_000566 [Exophiala xenobiotica]|nr:hypothetical protein LTR70_000566 [Exophiala xenobiotica]
MPPQPSQPPKPLHAFRDFDRRRNGKRSCRNKGYLRLWEKSNHLMSEARSLEQLARGYMQLSVGILSLAESRASIKQSKIALEESKRTKLVTVLAFVFVPLSIGTSTFGMDLDELNGSGPRLWVFCLTTTVIFVLSALLWAVLSQVHKYYRRKESALVEHSPESDFTGSWVPVHWHFRLRLISLDPPRPSVLDMEIRYRLLASDFRTKGIPSIMHFLC